MYVPHYLFFNLFIKFLTEYVTVTFNLLRIKNKNVSNESGCLLEKFCVHIENKLKVNIYVFSNTRQRWAVA